MRDDAGVWPRTLLRCLFVSALLSGAASSGCGPAQVSLAIRPDAALNEQRPAYLLVRNVDSKTFLEETYQAAATKVMAPDDSVLETAVIFPDTRQNIQVSPPEKGQVAVYVFFYKPQGDWKALLPSGAGSFEVFLDGSRLRVERK